MSATVVTNRPMTGSDVKSKEPCLSVLNNDYSTSRAPCEDIYFEKLQVGTT